MLSTPSPTPPGKQGGSLLLSDGGTTRGFWLLRSILSRWVESLEDYPSSHWYWGMIRRAELMPHAWDVCFVFMSWCGFLTARNCVVEENVWSSLHSWQLHGVTPPLNYCFVLHTYVFSSANQHFFQLNFVVNQIKVKDRSRNAVPVSKVSVLCEKVQEQFSN